MAITKTRKSMAKRPLSKMEKVFMAGKVLIELHTRMKPKRGRMLKKAWLMRLYGMIKEAKKRIDKK